MAGGKRLWMGLGGAAVGVLVVVLLGLSWLWSRTPAVFSVTAGPDGVGSGVTGQVVSATLIRVGETLLDKPGGYISNDLLPPGVWLDNISNWEFGVLTQVRDLSETMRETFSRSQSQSVEDPDLVIAEPLFKFDSESWMLPATESEYRKALRALERYHRRLADPGATQAQFYARADNLELWLVTVETRLGSLSQRLAASVGQRRFNTDLAGEAGARQSTRSPDELRVKTPWREIDDVFFESRGAAWALLHFLRAIEVDFAEVLDNKNARVSLRQIIRELEATQAPIASPVILNGGGFGLFANHSLVMGSYIGRAHAAIIDLRQLLARG